MTHVDQQLIENNPTYVGIFFFLLASVAMGLCIFCLCPSSRWASSRHLSWSSVSSFGLRPPTCASRASSPFSTPAVAQIGGGERCRQGSSVTIRQWRLTRRYLSAGALSRGERTPTVWLLGPGCRATACIQALIKEEARFVALSCTSSCHKVRSSSPGRGPHACALFGRAPRQAPSYSSPLLGARMLALDARPRLRSAAERQAGHPPRRMLSQHVSHALNSSLRGGLPCWLNLTTRPSTRCSATTSD